MEKGRENKHQFNVGKWMPIDYELIRSHIKGIKSYVAANPTDLSSSIVALNEYVKDNPQIHTWSNAMFTEVPQKYRHLDYGTELKSWSEFIPLLLNGIMTMTSTFNKSGCVGFPINSLLDWAMGTEAGHNFFLDNGVNEHFNKVLNDWGVFLKNSASKYTVLNSNESVSKYAGHFEDTQYYWLSDNAMVAMANSLNDGIIYTEKTAAAARKKFIKTFYCPDLQDPHYGFTSWDHFFTRTFNSGMRNIAKGDDVIANACESGPYRVAYNVKKKNKYWIKGQPYSLLNIFNETEGNSPLTNKYEGGTIYQAFLSAENYHRWHSPVDGIVKTAYETAEELPFDSSYYSELLPSNPLNEDPAGPNESQGYIANLAARGIIEIAANNEAIGDMVVVPIGMAECSTCEITVKAGDPVTKGEEIGMFHFGGSTHLLIFQKNIPILFDYHGQMPNINAASIPVNSKVATVVKDSIPYKTEEGESGLSIGNSTTVNKNSGAILAVVPSNCSAYPINVGNYKGEYLWGVDASGQVNTIKGTAQASNPGASCNLNINFPKTGSSGYVIGDNPNDLICAALKIIVPSSACENWPLVVADENGNTIWAINCNGVQSTANPTPTKESNLINMPYPSTTGGDNALTIGDVASTTGCYGGISIILPQGHESSGIYAIAIVDVNGSLLWGVDATGKETTS